MQLSQYNSSLTEDGLRTNPESQYFERKGRDTKPSKIANELIGMINAGGGTLVYGIADDGVVEDLQQGDGILADEAPNLDRYRRLVHEFIKPPANIELEEVYLANGELLFLYHVEQDYERLFQRKDIEEVFLRIGDSNFGPLDREQVKKLEYNKNVRAYEDELREDFHPGDFDSAMCESYRKSMHYKGSFEDLALKRRLAVRKGDAIIFKNAAILLFAKDPGQYIANAYPYNLQGNAIYIKHFDDRLEISNSGPLPAQVTTENIREQRYARNPQLARVLADMKYVRELNEGVPRIFNAMRESMLAQPVYKDEALNQYQ